MINYLLVDDLNQISVVEIIVTKDRNSDIQAKLSNILESHLFTINFW